MSDANDLAAFLDEAWQHLRRGVADSRSLARYPAFATVSPDGRPEVRTVALRRASRPDAELDVHTDILTPKIAALRHAPYAELHVWLPKPRMQIRLQTTVEILTGTTVEDIWADVPKASRVSYGTEPPPGTPIASVFDYEKPPVQARFAVLRCAVDRMDLVHLGERHRRAEFLRANDWAGTWVAP